MSIWGTFWLLKAKKWGKMGQKRCARSGLHHIWLIIMKSVQNEKVPLPQMIMVCQKNFHISKEKIIFWLFLWFWKNHKNGQKLKVEIFLAHLNHLGKLYFFIFYTFWFVKNQKLKLKIKINTFVHGQFLPFCQKMPKIPIFMKNSFS